MINFGNLVMFTHNDADAIGCALLGELTKGYKRFIPFFCGTTQGSQAVNKWLDNITEEEAKSVWHVMVTDISIDVPTADRLVKFCKEHEIHLQGYDHHRTNTEVPAKYPEIFVCRGYAESPKISACEIMLNDWGVENLEQEDFEKVEPVIKAISRYDTWEWKDHPQNLDEDAVSILSKFYTTPVCYHMMMDNYRQNGEFISSADWAFIKTQKRREKEECEKYDPQSHKFAIIPFKPDFPKIYGLHIEESLAEMFSERKETYNMGIVINEGFEFSNAVMEYINSNNPEIDFLIGIGVSNKFFNFRSKKSYVDVSVLAKALGGGGHKSAAGASHIPTDTMLSVLKLYFENR